jgi:predicted ATPase
MKRYILTGTAGAGKTSVLRFLETLGHRVVEEAATDVIALEQALGVMEPWKLPDFIDKIIRLQRQRQQQAARMPSPVQFFDRSPIDTYALSLYLHFPPSEPLLAELERIEREVIYEKQVFFLENLGFCQPTEARRISYEQALHFETIHEAAFLQYGYELVRIPRGPIAERAHSLERLISV